MKEKTKMTLAHKCICVLAVYFIFITALYFIAGDQFQNHSSPGNIKSVQGSQTVGNITKDLSIKQTFLCNIKSIRKFSIEFATYGRQNTGSMLLTLTEADSGKVLYQTQLDLSALQDNTYAEFMIPEGISDEYGKMLSISLESGVADSQNVVTAYYNNARSIQNSQLYLGGNSVPGSLNFTVEGVDPLIFGRYYFEIMFGLGLLLALYLFLLWKREKLGKPFPGLSLLHAFTKYRFLLQQLVSRDFKTKYKRSVLGVLWSFLNPLLSMSVQYVVFSTFFRSNIQNYAVYLLIGIVFFNFFIEATTIGLTSIVDNTSLITKVYIPKFIFPVSRVFSSSINLLLSFLPLLIVVLITRTTITPAIFILPFDILCILIFCIGMAMLLSAFMVFFRDVQFLWSVVSMLWMYMTPIFYPESALPAKYLFVFKLNPLYHFIRFCRTLIISGVSPEPQAYLLCIVMALIPFLIGLAVFKRTQDKFILYI